MLLSCRNINKVIQLRLQHFFFFPEMYFSLAAHQYLLFSGLMLELSQSVTMHAIDQARMLSFQV